MAIYSDIRATDISVWPDKALEAAWALPVLSLPLVSDQGALAPEEPVDEIAAADLFPKLAVKSWRDSGHLRMIAAGAHLDRAVAARLLTPTRQQRLLLSAWRDADEPPYLHLFPWRPTATTTEARVMVQPDGVVRTVSICHRRQERVDTDGARALAGHIAAAFASDRSLILQFAFDASGAPRLVDINPGLTPTDLSLLTDESGLPA